MEQQTAVEWLFEQYKKNGFLCYQDEEQAKEKEREQIIRTWENGNLPTAMGRVLTAEQYYTQNYGK